MDFRSREDTNPTLSAIYNYIQINDASEQQREQQRQERIAELRRRFVDGPVLLIRGGGGGSSDSRWAVVIPGVGTVYFGAIVQKPKEWCAASLALHHDPGRDVADDFLCDMAGNLVLRRQAGSGACDEEMVQRRIAMDGDITPRA